MSTDPAFPPLDGSITAIPGLVDFQVEHGPDRSWAVFPAGSPVKSVSYKEFADATHRVAHTFCPDKKRADGEVVALIIHCDSALYLALLAGLIRAGFIPFPMSPKNSVPAFINLLEKTSCRRIISQPAFSSLVEGIQSQLAEKKYDVRVDELPGLHDVFPGIFAPGEAAPVDPFPPATKPHSPDDNVLYLHSSGSTGFPKPVPQKQNFMLEFCTSSIHEGSRKDHIIWGSFALPNVHTIGVYMQLLPPFSTSFPVGLFPPMAPAAPMAPTPNSVLEACKTAGVSGIPIVPAFIEAWAKSEESLNYLATLKHVGFSGGPVSEQGGAKLVAAGVNFFAVYGTTESGVHTKAFDADDSQGLDGNVRTSLDWQWLSFGDNVKCRWVPEGDGSYELQFLTCEGHHPSIENLPDVRGYATHDLFVPHPTKKGLWRITGRKDDVIVLSTGEKVVPIPQEGRITSSPLASGAVMFGRGRNECGILIDPSPANHIDVNDPTAVVDFRNKIWPVIEEANRVAPTYARIFKEMILVTDPAKPLPRAAKGTVVRPQALNAYAAEIDNLYETVADSADSRGIALPATWSVDDIEPWLMKHCASINDGVEISPARDFFDQGFDSLHATFLRNRIIGTLRASPDPQVQQAATSITPSFIFDHPILLELASAIASVVAPQVEEDQKDLGVDIQKMLDSYVHHLPNPLHAANGVAPEKVDVLLTGSTGNVGAHILTALLSEPKVHHVYTLNRPSASLSAAQRQAAAFKDRGLPVDLLTNPKLTQLLGDVTLDGFGLEAAQFEQVKKSITHVVHNAWRVDFNLSLPSFEKYIAGTRRLVDLCCSLQKPVKLLFTSSVAAAYKWDISRGAVPEEVLSDTYVASANGYGASKFVTENLLARAADNGLETTSLRIGQICGPKDTGAWGTSEWVPILIKSSVALGKIPDLEGTVSWIPMDAVATTITDLVISQQHLPQLLNVVHPRPVAWRDVFRAVNATLGHQPFPVVPYDEWVQLVEKIAAQGKPQDLERVPAIKILQFLHGIAAFEKHATTLKVPALEAGGVPSYQTDKLQRFSPSVVTLEPLGELHAKAWVKYWKSQGFLNM